LTLLTDLDELSVLDGEGVVRQVLSLCDPGVLEHHGGRQTCAGVNVQHLLHQFLPLQEKKLCNKFEMPSIEVRD
jgi:hypothetical protein